MLGFIVQFALRAVSLSQILFQKHLTNSFEFIKARKILT